MDFRCVIRAGAWTAGGLMTLVLVVYLALVIINWNDEPPSIDAERMVALERGRPMVADEANAYVHALGLAAAPDADPVALGRQRKAWMDAFVAPTGEYGPAEFPGSEPDYRAARTQEVAALTGACSEAASCLDALGANPDALNQWLGSEQWLLDRYRRMLSLQEWRETIPHDPRAPLAGYHHALEAQKLHLLTVQQHATAREAAIVRELLESDLAFWRQVLASSDLLISKMIAAAAVKRHFVLGNLALRELPPEMVDEALPPSWRQPMTDAERSLARAFAGEWHFGAGAISMAMSSDGLRPYSTGWGLFSERLLRPLLQPQATFNLSAERMVQLGKASQLPYPELVRAIENGGGKQEGEQRLFRLYNPVGTMLDSLAVGADYTSYIARANDLEGLRRAVLLAATMRKAGVQPKDVAHFVGNSNLRNPYSGAPFEWDQAAGSVVFRGMEKGARGRHTVLL